jgi:hypothetical protein
VVGERIGVEGALRLEDSGLNKRGECDRTGVVLADWDVGALVGVPIDWLDAFFGIVMVRPSLLPVLFSPNGVLVETRLRNWSEIVTSTRYLILVSFSL